MEHEVHPVGRPLGEHRVGEIAFEHLGAAEMREVVALARDEIVSDADAMPAPQQFRCQM